MRTSLKQDLQRLSQLAYHRAGWAGHLVRELHRLRRKARRHPDLALLEEACAWLFVPLALSPIDFIGLCTVAQQRVAAGERFEDELRTALEMLPPLPDAKTLAIVGEHEQEVRRGDYEGQWKTGEKYDLRQQALLQSTGFQRDWAALKARFPVEAFRDGKGIIRRRMVAERGFRPDWQVEWEAPGSRFQAVFDLFCHRWGLYGMAGDEPLLMKLTVHLIPQGTMIVIPSWWSLDHMRDLNWAAVKRLHAARVPSRQGPKLTRNQWELDADARRAALLDAEARRCGLKGERREAWVMTGLRWPSPDSRKLRRLLVRAKRHGVS